MFTAAGGDVSSSVPGNDTKQPDGESNSVNESSSLTNNLNSINRASLITLSQFTDLWRRMCQSNHDEASQFFYVVTKAADIASNFSTAATDNSDSSSNSTFSYLTKTSDYSNSNPTTTGTGNNLNSSSYTTNNNFNNKKFAAIKNEPSRTFILPEDLVILIQDVVDSHPGLGFLKEATEFHSRYVHTVSYIKNFTYIFTYI